MFKNRITILCLICINLVGCLNSQVYKGDASETVVVYTKYKTYGEYGCIKTK